MTVYKCESACSYQSTTASTILGTILSIQPKDSSSGSGETRESIVYRLAEDMLDKLPSDYIPFEVQNRLVKMGMSVLSSSKGTGPSQSVVVCVAKNPGGKS